MRFALVIVAAMVIGGCGGAGVTKCTDAVSGNAPSDAGRYFIDDGSSFWAEPADRGPSTFVDANSNCTERGGRMSRSYELLAIAHATNIVEDVWYQDCDGRSGVVSSFQTNYALTDRADAANINAYRCVYKTEY